jgi:hypothetical protein
MSTETPVRDGMRALAGQARPVSVPDDFFDRVRQRARQRRAVRGVAAIVAVLTVTVGLALRPGGGTEVPGDPGLVTVGLPRTLHLPPLRTGLVEQSPPGTAAAIFGGPATWDNFNEGRFAVVAADSDRYRVFNEFTYTPPGSDALLSPDGDLVARNRTVLSLRPDRQVSIVLPGDPRAFSPDGTLLVYETGDGTTYIDGVQRRESRIAVYDLARRTEIASVDNSDNFMPIAVAVSPDNGRLAVQVDGDIRLYRLDVAHPVAYATVRLTDEALAGQGAWLPDSRSFVTARRVSSQGWRLLPYDGETGAARPGLPFPDLVDSRYVRVIGWRTDGTVIAITGVPQAYAAPAELFGDSTWIPYPDNFSIRARLVVIAPDGSAPAVMLQTPNGAPNLDVAVDLAIAGQFRAAGPPDYGPFAPFFVTLCGILLAVIGVPSLIAAGFVWRVVRRRRRRSVA